MKRFGDILGMMGGGISASVGTYFLTDSNTIPTGLILLATGIGVIGFSIRSFCTDK